jgi:hypothetical protein
MYWDDVVIAMVLEKAKQFGHHQPDGLSISKAISWFRREFPRIENFQRLNSSIVLGWKETHDVYDKVWGEEVVDHERKELVSSWILDEVTGTPSASSSCYTISNCTMDSLWLKVQARLDGLRTEEKEAARYEPFTVKGWDMTRAWFENFVLEDLGLSIH